MDKFIDLTWNAVHEMTGNLIKPNKRSRTLCSLDVKSEISKVLASFDTLFKTEAMAKSPKAKKKGASHGGTGYEGKSGESLSSNASVSKAFDKEAAADSRIQILFQKLREIFDSCSAGDIFIPLRMILRY